VEQAWIVSRDDEVEAVLSDKSLGVRPPDEPAPRAMQGTVLGEIFVRLARMNDGSRHRELRANVEARLAAWNLADVARLTTEAVGLVEASEIAGYVIGSSIGLQNPRALLPDIRSFADAVAAGAGDDAIARGVDAAERLLAALPDESDADQRANDLGLLFQAYRATARLLDSALAGRTDPPVVMTRRYNTAGETLAVLLIAPQFNFGAGLHRCPGREIAETIAFTAAAAIRARAVADRIAAADAANRPA
jgi:cytochrome P450